MIETRIRRLAVIGLLSVAAAACEDDPTNVGFTTDELTADLAITPDHVHAFETMVTFTVAVTDPNGDPVTDFDVLQVERRKAPATTFSVMEATLAGDFYVVDHIFEGSGDYDIRVTGLRPGDADLVVLHEEATQLHTVRPHAEEGGRRIELEPNPGHIHEGDTSDVQFWLLDPTTRVGITGLTPTIFLDEPTGGVTEYAATEGADGLYHASHMFTEAGATAFGIRFMGTDAVEHEWSLDIEVHHAH
ncbi:MAG: hypothetical protein AB7T31_03070 [Gemmatimonadales bacterium]